MNRISTGLPATVMPTVIEVTIRPAEEDDAAAIAKAYAPYTRVTAISFETDRRAHSISASGQ
jgi:hypothetical protein